MMHFSDADHARACAQFSCVFPEPGNPYYTEKTLSVLICIFELTYAKRYRRDGPFTLTGEAMGNK